VRRVIHCTCVIFIFYIYTCSTCVLHVCMYVCTHVFIIIYKIIIDHILHILYIIYLFVDVEFGKKD
jgi:hypothetical protein